MSTPIETGNEGWLSDTASVLYFPHIKFTDTAWLKASLLLWDTVYRIVPKDYQPDDPYPVKEAADAGLVKAIQVEPEDLERISGEFVKFVSGIRYKPAGLDGTQTERLHKGKVDGRLYPLLDKIAIDLDPDGFMQVPRHFARFYMLYLAKAMAGRRRLACATDERDAWSILPYFLERGNFAQRVYDEEAKGYYSALVFEDLIPASVGAVEMGDVVKFVQKRGAERAIFRNSIREFAAKLTECESIEAAKETIEIYKSRIETAKVAFTKSMEFGNTHELFSLLTMGVPVSANVYKAMATPSEDIYSMAAKIGTSVLMGAVAAYAQYGHGLKKRKASAISYLVDVDEMIAKKRRVPIYWRSFEEFMND